MVIRGKSLPAWLSLAVIALFVGLVVYRIVAVFG
jgi:hypothetical protein